MSRRAWAIGCGPRGTGNTPRSVVRSTAVDRRHRGCCEAQEARHELVGRPLPELLRRPDGLDAAGCMHGHAVGERERLLLVVRDVDDRQAELASNSAASSPSRRSRSARSSAPSGSSSISSRGSGASARASATRCCSPPESSATAPVSKPGQPDQLEHLGDARATLARARRPPCAGRRRRCRARRGAGTARSPGTSGRSRRRCDGHPREVAAVPRDAPAASGSRPAIARSSVDLPAAARAEQREPSRASATVEVDAVDRAVAAPKRDVRRRSSREHQSSPSVRHAASGRSTSTIAPVSDHQDVAHGHRLAEVAARRAGRAAGRSRSGSSACRAGR